MTYESDALRYREALAGDPQRPAYHFTAPRDFMNDPNGTVYWKGRWHLFYQYAPGLLCEGSGPVLAQWAHAVSEDLVHWQDLPLAITPTPGTYDEKGCWSGTAVVDGDRVVACYHAHQGGNAIAVASDEMLTDWQKLPSNPFVSFDPAKTYDPCIWKEGDTFYSASGRITGAKYGDGRDQEFGGKDIAYLYKSKDLEHWEEAGVLYEGGVFTNPGEDCACPDFFPIGDRYMLLFLAHNSGAQYYLGSYANERFTPEVHGRMNFNQPGLGVFSGELAAPIAWKGPGERRVFIGWVLDGRGIEAMKKAGWGGLLSLPRDLSLGPDGLLRINPVPELESLRRNQRSFSAITLADSAVELDGVQGDAIEIRATIDCGSAKTVGLKVRRSPDGEEETLVWFDPAEGALCLDPSRASLDPEATENAKLAAPFALEPGEPLELRVFLDRSVIEVFANGRQCVTKRIYPSRRDSLGVQFFAEGGESTVGSLDVWDMAPIWPVR